MLLSNPRTITLVVAVATLISNLLSSILLHRLPDDSYHLASNCGWYLHFANLLSVFGLIGALRQNAPSIAIFANFLLIDTILSALPRFAIPLLLQNMSSTLCSPNPYNPPAMQNLYIHAQHSITSSSSSPFSATPSVFNPTTINGNSFWDAMGHGEECQAMMRHGQIALGVGAIGATVLQFVGALFVRGYARKLWLRDSMDEDLHRSVDVDVEVAEVLLPSEQSLGNQKLCTTFEEDEKV